MPDLNPKRAYQKFFQDLIGAFKPDVARRMFVGGDQDFDRVGSAEFAIIQHFGLKPDASLVDVGCGSGRLARYLVQWPHLQYLGTDVVPEVIEYCTEAYPRHFRFAEVQNTEIPASDTSADMVAFFSVFTHLLHEQTFQYLSEAKRVLRPGGRIVFSFLEYACAAHHDIFRHTFQHFDEMRHLNVFIERNAIEFFAAELGLTVIVMRGGDEPTIKLDEPVRRLDGTTMSGHIWLGQSLCVLEKPTDVVDLGGDAKEAGESSK
ncbi:class I SAM-dependent methyltransferase [Microvirga sp. TS319]|uniref:class I SAM-dependent methyltransferase n=1 Tax=Microvirga sp. TS319 TaxID=3241165 RepID=UPI00351A5E37